MHRFMLPICVPSVFVLSVGNTQEKAARAVTATVHNVLCYDTYLVASYMLKTFECYNQILQRMQRRLWTRQRRAEESS